MLQDFMGVNAWYDLSMRLEYHADSADHDRPVERPQLSPRQCPPRRRSRRMSTTISKCGAPCRPAPFPSSDQGSRRSRHLQSSNSASTCASMAWRRPRRDEEHEYIPEYMLHPANMLQEAAPRLPGQRQGKGSRSSHYMATARRARPAAGLFHRAAVLVHLVSRHRSAGDDGHSLPDRACDVSVHHRLLHAAHVHADVDDVALVHPSRLPAAFRRRHDDDDLAALSHDRSQRSGALGRPPDRPLVVPGQAAACVNRWRALFRLPAFAGGAVQPSAYSPNPLPSVSANFAIRLLQVHLCIIYFVSGIEQAARARLVERHRGLGHARQLRVRPHAVRDQPCAGLQRILALAWEAMNYSSMRF